MIATGQLHHSPGWLPPASFTQGGRVCVSSRGVNGDRPTLPIRLRYRRRSLVVASPSLGVGSAAEATDRNVSRQVMGC